MCLKIMLSGDLAFPNEIQLEITTENDLFFCYKFTLTDPGYGIFARDNDLNTPYEQFPLILKTLIQDVGSQKGGMNFQANLELGGTGNANAILKFLADTQFSTVLMLQLELEMVDEEDLKEQVTFRINSQKQKTMLTAQRVKQILELV